MDEGWLKSAPPKDLFRAFDAIMCELRARELGRSSNNRVADYAEGFWRPAGLSSFFNRTPRLASMRLGGMEWATRLRVDALRLEISRRS